MNNAPAIHIREDRRIGFGTTDLEADSIYKFQFPGTLNFPSLQLASPLGNAQFAIRFTNPDTSWILGPNVGNQSDDRLAIVNGTSYRGLVLAPNGHVGIGNAQSPAPPTALSVDGSISFTTVAAPALYIYQSGTANAQKPVISHSPAYPGYAMWYRDDGDRLEFKSSENDVTPSLAVDLDSNWVAIANPTPKPGYELSVNGQIVCEDLLIQDSSLWPDYVFEPEYRLRPLDEVEAHIRERRHLPGVPSAAEVETQGLSMSDMSRRMMEKIEELTLYAIEQHRRLEAREREVAELQRSGAALKEVVDRLQSAGGGAR